MIDVITKGLWSESETLGDDWNYELLKADELSSHVINKSANIRMKTNKTLLSTAVALSLLGTTGPNI